MELISPLKISLIVIIVVLIFNTIISTLLFFNLKKFNFFRKLMEFLFILPIFLPPSVIGYIILILLGKRGVIGNYLFEYFNIKFTFNIYGAIIASIIISFPLTYQNISLAFEEIEASYIETGYCLGLNKFQMLKYIYIPMGYKNLLSGIILTAGRTLGEFGATILVAGNIPGETQTLTTALYSAIESGDTALINHLFIIIIIISSTLLSLYLFLKYFSNKKSSSY